MKLSNQPKRKIIKTLFDLTKKKPEPTVTAEHISESYNATVAVPPIRKRLMNPMTTILLRKK